MASRGEAIDHSARGWAADAPRRRREAERWTARAQDRIRQERAGKPDPTPRVWQPRWRAAVTPGGECPAMRMVARRDRRGGEPHPARRQPAVVFFVDCFFSRRTVRGTSTGRDGRTRRASRRSSTRCRQECICRRGVRVGLCRQHMTTPYSIGLVRHCYARSGERPPMVHGSRLDKRLHLLRTERAQLEACSTSGCPVFTCPNVNAMATGSPRRSLTGHRVDRLLAWERHRRLRRPLRRSSVSTFTPMGMTEATNVLGAANAEPEAGPCLRISNIKHLRTLSGRRGGSRTSNWWLGYAWRWLMLRQPSAGMRHCSSPISCPSGSSAPPSRAAACGTTRANGCARWPA